MPSISTPIPYALIAVGTLVLMLAVAPTNIGTLDTPVDVTVTAWYSCVRVQAQVAECKPTADPNIECDRTRSIFQATQAFYVMTGLGSVMAIVVGAVESLAGLPRRFCMPHVPLGLSGVVLTVFAGVGFATAVASQTMSPCGDPALNDRPGYSWGPSAFLILAVFVGGLALTVLGLLYRPADAVVAKKEGEVYTNPVSEPKGV